MIGTTLQHYRIEGQLGSGGMGEVYLARDSKLHRRVALKILPLETAGDAERLRRFQREAQAVAALNHPNVVTIYSVEETDGLHFLTMELVDGKTLTRMIGTVGLDVLELLTIAVPLADGLAAAHQRGIIHRDLKPGNVMLTAEGRVKILDFGLAKLKANSTTDFQQSLITTDHMTGANRIMGTPAYMSPEQAEGKEVDFRSDIFSVGVILYEMATGKRPFAGDTVMSVISSILKDTPRSVAEIKPELPWELDRIIKRCLAKDPDRRYQSSYDLRNDLDELRQTTVAGRPHVTALSHPTIPQRAGLRWLVTGLIAASLAAAGYLAYQRQSRPARIHATFSQLTTLPGVEWFPSLSPDGKWVVYSGEHSGNREIYLQSVGGQNAINLTNDAAFDDQPTFDRSGERIAFRSTRDGGGIFVMGRTGEAVRRVTRTGFNPAWSPDGAHLAFTSQPMELNPQNTEGISELWVVSVNGGAPRRLSAGDAIQANWSPRNHRIAYAVRLGTARQMDIWTIPAAGGDPTAVTADQATDWNPVWSPDGRHLYFVSDRGGSMNLWRVPIGEETGRTTGPPEPVTTPAQFLAHIAISTDGRRIAYSSIVLGQNIQKLAFDPVTGTVVGQPVDVTTGTRLLSSPDPSRDGQSVVFYSRVQPEGDLYVVRADGTGFRQVTSDTAIDRVPRWSPDGQWIVCFSNRSGALQLWRVRPDGSELQQITDMSGDFAMPAWSPDGRRIAVSTVTPSARGVRIFDPARPWKQQKPEVLPHLAGGDGFVVNSWSPDAQRLVGQAGFSQGIITYSLRSRTYDRVTDFGEWAVWLPDSRRVLFVSRGKEFFVADTESKEIRKVFSVTRDVLGPPRLTGDGREAYFSRRVTEGDVWVATLE